MSDEAPGACPTCGTAVAPGAARCVQCGRVFGEANRCPHCHAIAAVRRAGAGYACLACGKPREVSSSTTVIDGGRASRIDALSVGGVDPASGAIVYWMRALGGALVAAAIVSGAAAALGSSASVALLAVVAAVLGVGGVTIASQAGRVESRAKARRARQLEQRLLAHAQAKGGDVLATEAAKELGIGLAEADAALSAMSDGSRVALEVDSEGMVHYVFREIIARRAGPKVRIDPASERESIEAEAAARVERELARRERL